MKKSPTFFRPRQSHGQSYSREYTCWRAARARCINPNDPKFSDYGGRGISMCSAWLDSFEQFLQDMGERPEGRSLDRIDVNGNYEPGNCRWATPSQQSKNTRRARYVNLTGENHHYLDAAPLLGLTKGGMKSRVWKGWSLDKLATPKIPRGAPHKVTPDVVAKILEAPLSLSAKKLGPQLGLSHMTVNRVRRGLAAAQREGRPLHVPSGRK